MDINSVTLEMTTQPYSVSPLSIGQQALWFLYQIAPESVAYNIFTTVRIQSELEISRLRHALQTLLDRHPILRTTYSLCDEEPVQQIHDRQVVDFQMVDASSWDEEALNAQILTESDRPFDLEQGPVLRIHLFTRTPDDHILLLTMHHIAGDMWSFDILLSELQVLYASTTAASLPQSLPYTAYVQWQSDLLTSSSGEELWQYWQTQLAGELPALNLPTDKPRPPIQTYSGASYSVELTAAIISTLRSFVAAEKSTLYTVLLSVFQVLLYRYSNQADLVVGVPIAGRIGDRFNQTIGYFSNPLPIRVTVSGDSTFQSVLSQTRRAILDAKANQSYPFPRLVQQLNPDRDPSRSPVFQVSFTSQKQRWCRTPLKSETPLQMQPYLLGHQRGAAFDLDLVVMEAEADLQICCQYNTDLFEAATITRMMGHYQTLLSNLLAHPEQKIAQLQLLTTAEQYQLLMQWNQTQTDYPQNWTIHQLIEAQVEQAPQAIAVIFETEHLTYQQLNDRANQLAHYLQTLGGGPNQRVGICVERSLDMAVGFLGILKAGAAYVPLDPAYPSERLIFMLEDAQPLVLLTQERLLNSLPAHQIQVICLDADWPKIAQQSPDNPAVAITAEHLAYVMYTSGSTGKPKGVMIPHRGLVNHNLAIAQLFEISANDRILQSASISFDIAVEEIFPTWIRGGTLILRTENMLTSTSTFLQFVEKAQITILDLPTALWHEIVNGMLVSGYQLPRCLRLLVVGGEKASKDVYSNWWSLVGNRCRWINTYGPTETTVSATFYEPAAHPERQFSQTEIPIGRPLANVQLYILDQQLQPVPVGIPGELYIGGAGIAQGYLGRPDLTASKFIPNPFGDSHGSYPCKTLYRTGDLVRYLSDGNLEFIGRIDDQVKLRGFRVELGEIETSLNRSPNIKETLVVLREDKPGDQHLTAYIVPFSGQKITTHELQTLLKTQLPSYMIPSHFVTLAALPLTPNGKIDRQSLPIPQADELQRAQAFVAPQNDLERQLTQIWERVLGIESIGIQDNFFDLGGHSLIALRLLTEIERIWQRNIPLSIFLKAPTIQKFAEVLQQTELTDWSAVVPIQAKGSKPPLFCIHPLGGNILEYNSLGYHLGDQHPVYGLQARGLDGNLSPLNQIEAMATYYIEEIRRIQPEGPYYLLGYSFGGLVAFEMAQQLQAQAQQVGLLALLDTSSPNLPEIRPSWIKAIQIHLRNLKQLKQGDRLKYMRDRILFQVVYKRNYKDLLIDQWAEPLSPPYLDVLEQNFHASQTYIGQVYPGTATLFRCSVQELSQAIHPDLGWSELITGHLAIHHIPGHHNDLLKVPNVRLVAETLKFYLK